MNAQFLQNVWPVLVDAGITAAIAVLLTILMLGFKTVDQAGGLALVWRFDAVGWLAAMIFCGRMLFSFIEAAPGRVAALALGAAITLYFIPLQESFLRFIGVTGGGLLFCMALHKKFSASAWAGRWQKIMTSRTADRTLLLLLIAGLLLPVLPFTDRYLLDVMVMLMTYLALAFGLNIIVGYAGLLDLGYVGFYAIGAYSTALLAQNFGFGFWSAMPFAGFVAALVAGIIGGPVLRLRGDYLAIVTLGFAEIVRLALINWGSLTGGPNGISGVPRPTLFGLEFTARPAEGAQSFHEYFGMDFSPVHRMVFLYYLLLALAVAIGLISISLRRLPLGRAWEALREDEIACAAMGINRARIKLCAYMLGAFCAGLCGAFFATRQGFISPESFSFMETCAVLAIVVLGGAGHHFGIVLAAFFIIGLPELFRELEQYRMVAFGLGMVIIMIWRPGGIMAARTPAVRLGQP